MPNTLPGTTSLADLRARIAKAELSSGPVLPFGVAALDGRLARGGLATDALHEATAAGPTLSDEAAATLFLAGIAARCRSAERTTVLWALTRFDLYAPGLEQAGLGPDTLLLAEARDDAEVLARVEDAARHGSLAAVVGEIRRVGMTATRRLQLAAAEGTTPILLLRRRKRSGVCSLTVPSAATTRWRIGSAPSGPLDVPGVGRPCWSVELVRQRGGPSFSTILESSDEAGRLAPPAGARDPAAATAGPLPVAA